MAILESVATTKCPLIHPLTWTSIRGEKFTKLDLSQAYQQQLLDESSKELTTITTHQGLYRYCCLPFGIASAPAIFKRTMDKILQGIPNVICYIDITGSDDEQHLKNLAKVLRLFLLLCGVQTI